MSKSIRIRTNVGNDNALSSQNSDKNIKVQLDQDFDFIEILSLKISQEEAYRRFCSDYGVVVGRVIVNNGFGVPNAKVSIFIPITDEDRENEEIRDLYPFEVVTDKDADGVRYNLLPKQRQNECHTPVGTVPNKREIQDNDTMLEIYEKYYKFTTTTNESGDFMIFGVPVGNHLLHMDVDISDIGILSQRPYDFISQGVPKEKFDSPTKFSANANLDNLPQIKTQNVGVNVIPFWGDPENCEIGITRVDMDLNYNLQPAAIFMGSIFGDSEKNSINKRCRPRKDLGKICEMITGEGSVEMIRKRPDGSIERFDVQGGRVIDENGVWSYQVPMNLDYVVTDEFGNLVPSEDPNRGIPTRARVRFRIGLDITGDEGRLRTRAKYLVPHNPDSFADSDYSFDETTSDEHFRDLSWNKVYTVRNFIPRFQTSGGGNNRNFIGIKNVDNCVGDKNPFPYNRLDGDFNPLFSIICIIINIIVLIVSLINSVIISIINIVLAILNVILNAILSVIFGIGVLVCALKHLTSSSKRKACRTKICTDLGGTCTNTKCSKCDLSETIPYLPCIVLECDSQRYAPGCPDGSEGLDAANDNAPVDHWTGDGHGHSGLGAGYAECVSLELAQSLNVFEFEFYNDWVNGTLYSFLLKYKKKKKGKEKFCEYDCDDFGGGVDGNNDGNPDNRCKRNWLVDTCTGDGAGKDEKDLIKDGLIKKYEDNYYYAAYTHEKDYKLFATDIMNLGAVFECDWQGKPKIIQELTPTSYIIPPLTGEFDDTTNELVNSGMDGVGFQDSLFFSISCLGINTNTQNCVNISRICEIGVGLDEDRQDEPAQLGCSPSSGSGGGAPDAIINNCDIDDLFIRDALAFLNVAAFTSLPTNMIYGSSNYNTYRDISNQTIKQPRGNSFYFYFGTENGKTAIDKTFSKFFTTCEVPEENDFIIDGTVVDVTTFNGSDGGVNITVIGGVGPFTYSWTGPNGFTSTTEDITNVPVGTYTVTVIDSEGNSASASFTVIGPFPIVCDVTQTPTSQFGTSDGEILVSSVGGGTGPYTAVVVNNGNSNTYGPQNIVGGSTLFTGLPAGNYTVTVTDSSSPNPLTCVSTIDVTEPPELLLSVATTDVPCNGFNDGEISINASGGVPPYTYSTTGPSSYSSSVANQTNLDAGTYTVTLSDSIGQSVSTTVTITEPPQITATPVISNITCNGAGDGSITLSSISGGAGSYQVKWEYPDGTIIPYPAATTQSGLSDTGTYIATIKDASGCEGIFEITLLEPTVLSVQIDNVSSYSGGYNIACNGDNNGFITISASGGNPASPINVGGYTYQLLNSSGTVVLQSNGTGTFTNLVAGTYQLRALDVNGCVSNSVIQSLTEPPLLTVSINKSCGATTCTLTALPSGGVTPYSYVWINSGGTVVSTSSSYNAPTASPDTYTVLVTDANGCSAFADVSVP